MLNPGFRGGMKERGSQRGFYFFFHFLFAFPLSL